MATLEKDLTFTLNYVKLDTDELMTKCDQKIPIISVKDNHKNR